MMVIIIVVMMVVIIMMMEIVDVVLNIINMVIDNGVSCCNGEVGWCYS